MEDKNNYRVWFNGEDFNIVLNAKGLKELRKKFKAKEIYELKGRDINLGVVKNINWVID